VGIDTDIFCDSACDGFDALKKIIDDVEENNQGVGTSYELILMDCNMPHLDGYEASDRIRQYLYGKLITQPIISAITGHTE
jgi:CheY-like chemotaxis protein